MKHYARKILCLLLAVSMMISLQGCSALKEMLAEPTERHYAGDHKTEWGEEPTETDETEASKKPAPTQAPDDGKYINTSKELTYPDHVASFDEVHPKHKPGSLKGQDAVNRLNEVEQVILKNAVSCYVDADILFENPEKVGITGIDPTKAWGDVTTPAAKYP